jgi:phosphoglycerate dehydrogenase-like enzyme
MTKIVVTNNQDFTPEQKQRLDSLGEVIYYDPLPENAEEYLERVNGADIICSGTAGLKDAYAQLKNVYVTVGFVSVAFVDLGVLAENNVKISNAPGANRHAVAEWIMYMMLNIQRRFDAFIQSDTKFRKGGGLPPILPGLANKNVTILGCGNIGARVGELAQAFDMNVRLFKRGDDLYQSVRDADIIVDTLSVNKSTHNLLDKSFFDAVKEGSSFITVTREEITDIDAMIGALDDGRLSFVAADCGGALVGDVDDPLYQRLKQHDKVFVTPHVSYNSEMSGKLGNDIMIDNVEAWISGEPQNLLN